MKTPLLKCVSNIQEFEPRLFQELGIGVEIQDFSKPNIFEQDWQVRLDAYKSLLVDFALEKTIHGPFIDLKPVSPDNLIRKITYDKYLHTIKIAKELEVDNIIFHSQINPWINKYNDREYLDANKRFWYGLLEDVGGFEKTIVLENIFEDDPIQLQTVVDYIDLSNIKVCLDIGHSRIRNNTALEDWFKLLGNRIHYIHMHWNDRLDDLHNAIPDEQVVQVAELVEKYTVTPSIALEYRTYNLNDEVSKVKKLFI